MPFTHNPDFAGLQTRSGNYRRNGGLSYIRTHTIYKLTVRAPLRRILNTVVQVFTTVWLFLLAVLLYAFGSFCRLPSIVLCRWLCMRLSAIQLLGITRSALWNCKVTCDLIGLFVSLPSQKHGGGYIACPRRWHLQEGNKQPRFFLQNVVFALLYSCYYFGSFVCILTIIRSSNITMALLGTTSSKYEKLFACRGKYVYFVYLRNHWGCNKSLATKASMVQISSWGWTFRGQTSKYRAQLLQRRFTSAQQLSSSTAWQLGRFDNLVAWQLDFLADWHIGSFAAWQLGILAIRKFGRAE